MRRALLALCVFALTVFAKDVRVSLRVTAANPGVVTVDRGARDGIEEGDTVYVFPRQGGAYRGVVQSVKDRSAIVELDDRTFKPDPGTRGEALVPEARFAEPEEEKDPDAVPPPPVVPPGGESGKKQTDPKWTNKDDEWEPGMPLLTDVKPVKPKDRSRRFVAGRVYTIVDFVSNPDGNFDNSVFRLGTDLVYRNPFKLGGGIRLNAEFSYLTEFDFTQDLELLLRRFSYYLGGDRFSKHRWEFGRFLQSGVAELGVLDGIEWGYRTDKKARFGVSMGFMPEPNHTFSTFTDFQIAGFAEWTSGVRQALTLTAALQKTWNNGDADRDLLIAKWVYAPGDGWDFRGTVWVDFYTGKDDLKDGAEVTLGIVSLIKRYASGSSWDINYRHQRYPQLLRNEIVPPVLADQIANDRFDRLWLNGRLAFSESFATNAHVGGWVDEDGSGGSAELGIEWTNFILRDATLTLTAFGTLGQFENLLGGRLNYGRPVGDARWDIFYEAANHHLLDAPDDRNDLVQHRVRVSGTLAAASGWDITVYGQAVFYDDQFNWSAGFTFQRRF